MPKKEKDELEQLGDTFTEAYRKIKARVAQLEEQVTRRDEEIKLLKEENTTLNEAIKEAERGVTLWEETAQNREVVHQEYMDRERTAFEMVIKTIVSYIEQYELDRGMARRYEAVILKGFRGLTDEQKEEYREIILQKTKEIESYANVLREANK